MLFQCFCGLIALCLFRTVKELRQVHIYPSILLRNTYSDASIKIGKSSTAIKLNAFECSEVQICIKGV